MYKIGDVVKLNSGGPLMTVTCVNEDGSIYCEWFPAVASASMSGSFPADAVKRA